MTFVSQITLAAARGSAAWHNKARSVGNAVLGQRVPSEHEGTVTSSIRHGSNRTLRHTVERVVSSLLEVFRIYRVCCRQDEVADDLTCIGCGAVSGFTPHFADVVFNDNLLNTIIKLHLWNLGVGYSIITNAYCNASCLALVKRDPNEPVAHRTVLSKTKELVPTFVGTDSCLVLLFLNSGATIGNRIFTSWEIGLVDLSTIWALLLRHLWLH